MDYFVSPVYGLLRESCLLCESCLWTTTWVLSMDYLSPESMGLLSVSSFTFSGKPWTRVFISLSAVIYDSVKVVLTRMSWIGFGEEAGGGGGGSFGAALCHVCIVCRQIDMSANSLSAHCRCSIHLVDTLSCRHTVLSAPYHVGIVSVGTLSCRHTVCRHAVMSA